MEQVSEPNTDSCLTAKELKNAGIRKRIGASESGNLCHKVTLYGVVRAKNAVVSLTELPF